MSTPKARQAEALLESGLRQFQQGLTEQARQAFEQALEIAPRHPDALHLLGVIALQRGEHAAAVDLLQRAVALNAGHPAYQVNLAYACVGLKRLAEALAAFERAARLAPGDAEIQLGIGNCLAMLGRAAQAEAVLRRLVERQPQYALGWFNLANAVRDQERYEEARDLYRRVTELAPRQAEAHSCLGAVLHKLGDFEAALAAYQRAEALRPQAPETQYGLGLALEKLGRADEAITRFRRAIALEPRHARAHNDLGHLLAKRGEIEEALACFHQALSAQADYPDAHYNLGVAYFERDRVPEGIACYDKALALKPDHVEARVNLAYGLLMTGDLERGWKEFEWRFRHDKPGAPPVLIRAFRYPDWNGEPLAGKSILVWGEQGVGDEIQHASMLPDVAGMAARCVFECSPKLVPLLSRSLPGVEVVPRADPPHELTQRGLDYQAPAGSLARWLRPRLASFPQRAGYLVPPPGRAAWWRQRLAALGPGLKVGFSWRSSDVKGERALYCTTLDQWTPVFGVPGVHFVNLQYDECSAELAQARERFGVPLHAFPEVDLFNDLDEAAALTAACDLVISAPTSVAFLAGAVGVPTWQMAFGVDWSMHGTDGYPWFPSITLFHRARSRPWEEVLELIGGRLRQRLAGAQVPPADGAPRHDRHEIA